MDLPAHTVRPSPESPTVFDVYDHRLGMVGKYAIVTAGACGAFECRLAGGWTLEKIKAAVEAAGERGELG